MILPAAQVVFAILVAGLSASRVPTYEWTDAATGEPVICQQCPPGTFVVNHCTIETQTACHPCPEQHYTQYWNYLEECRYCNVRCGARETLRQECNATHNRVCQCPPGYYRGAHLCVQHSKCDPGYGVAREGTATTDTRCVPCPPGTFSELSSAPCRPHTNCTEKGLTENLPGAPEHDALCTRCPIPHIKTSDPDCDNAVQDFVVYHIQSARRLRRLQKFWGSLENKKGKVLPHRNLRGILTKLIDCTEGDSLLHKVLKILNDLKLHSLEQKVRRRFLSDRQ